MATKIEYFEQWDEGEFGKVKREYFRFGKKVGHVSEDVKRAYPLEYSLFKNPPKDEPKAKKEPKENEK